MLVALAYTPQGSSVHRRKALSVIGESERVESKERRRRRWDRRGIDGPWSREAWTAKKRDSQAKDETVGQEEDETVIQNKGDTMQN